MDERKVGLECLQRRAGKQGQSAQGKRDSQLPRHGTGEAFLKGPIPLSWLEHAGGLPGKALHVGLALWFRAGMLGEDWIKVSNALVSRLGVERNAKRRALQQLAQAGLVELQAGTRRNASPLARLADPAARRAAGQGEAAEGQGHE
jgi:hypothetical protein